VKRKKTQAPAADAQINPSNEQATPVDSRQNDGGEGVIVTRGGADVGNAAWKNAEDAVDADDSPASGDPHR
jgi:hypothetical protein